MRVLAVDTTSERGSICITEGSRVLGEVRIASSMQHSERLFRSVEFLFRQLPFDLASIDLFVAARGPGSFTGLRVGMAAINGFASANRKRAAGISTLHALAWKTGLHGVLVAPTIDARRGEVFGAVYRREGNVLVEVVQPVVLKPEEWFAAAPRQPLVFCGDGASSHRTKIEETPEWKIHDMDFYLASSIAELAETPNCAPLEPLYIRRTDAEIARDQRDGLGQVIGPL